MDQFVTYGSDNPLPINVILDYEDIGSPCAIYQGNKINLPFLKNENGEADYNLWYHCMSSVSSKIIILGSDTDIWVYEMAFKGCSWLGDKVV